MNCRFVLIAVALLVTFHGVAQTNSGSARFLSLSEAIDTALVNNRAIQIQRINPQIARMTLRASWGYYDPLLVGDARRENLSESGAFDPLNPGLESGFTS